MNLSSGSHSVEQSLISDPFWDFCFVNILCFAIVAKGSFHSQGYVSFQADAGMAAIVRLRGNGIHHETNDYYLQSGLSEFRFRILSWSILQLSPHHSKGGTVWDFLYYLFLSFWLVFHFEPLNPISESCISLARTGSIRSIFKSLWELFSGYGNTLFDKGFLYKFQKKGGRVEWWVKTKSHIFIIRALYLSDMYTTLICIKSNRAGRSVFPVFFSHIAYHKCISTIKEHFPWESRICKLSRSRLKSSENFYHKSGAIYHRTSGIVRCWDIFFEVWYM